MNREKLLEKLIEVYNEPQDDLSHGAGLKNIVDFILSNFTPKEDVERDYVKKEKIEELKSTIIENNLKSDPNKWTPDFIIVELNKILEKEIT